MSSCSLFGITGPTNQGLQAAETVSAPLLRQAALFHAEHNLSQVSQQEEFRDVVSGTPGLAEVCHWQEVIRRG